MNLKWTLIIFIEMFDVFYFLLIVLHFLHHLPPPSGLLLLTLPLLSSSNVPLYSDPSPHCVIFFVPHLYPHVTLPLCPSSLLSIFVILPLSFCFQHQSFHPLSPPLAVLFPVSFFHLLLSLCLLYICLNFPFSLRPSSTFMPLATSSVQLISRDNISAT